jgi:hypothetical protein
MKFFQQWWHNQLPIGVKIVLLTLLANGLPAFIILLTFPNMTEILFVWTIKPMINARLIGVMYSNAMLLVGFSAFQTRWENVRTNMVVITLFSIFATVLTFFFLKPFLAHPWYHLAYWLTMYLILFFTAPAVFFTQEKKSGGKLPIRMPLRFGARITALISLITSLIGGILLIFNLELASQFWPWTLPPLVAGLIGVLLVTHAAAYAWVLWDGDWIRVRPMFWQAPITAFLFLLLPLVHPGDLRPDAGASLTLYYSLTGLAILANGWIILRHQKI